LLESMMPVKSQAPDSEMILRIRASAHAPFDATLQSARIAALMSPSDRPHDPVVFALAETPQRLRFDGSRIRGELELTETEWPAEEQVAYGCEGNAV
jgi:hypothetical protein